MRMGRITVVFSAVLLVAGAPARVGADEGEDEGPKQYTHKGQFELHGQSGVGFRFIAPYNEEFCGQVAEDSDNGANKKVCAGRSPLTMDAGIGFGVSRRLELFVELRLGLEDDFGASPNEAGPRQFAFSPGLKYYIRDAGLTKWFSTVQAVVDMTDYAQAGGTDFGLRNINGLQFDFHRTVGVYFFIGETMAFNRWFRFEFDGGMGLQVRVP